MANLKNQIAILKAAQQEFVALPVGKNGKRNENAIYARQRKLAAALAENGSDVSLALQMANRFRYPNKAAAIETK